MSLPVRKSALLAWTAALVLLVVVCLALFGRRIGTKNVAHGPGSQPATQPATGPASKPAKAPEPKYVATYMDFIHAEFPAFPVTQPLAMPLNLSEAARLVVKEPVYFDAPGAQIWITRPDAPPTETFLKKLPDDPERITITRERPLYVQWLPDARTVWWPFLVIRPENDPAEVGSGPGNFVLLSHLGRQRFGSRNDYRWGRAMWWNEKFVVPTATGVSVFRFAMDADGRPVAGPNGPTPIEDYQDLTSPGPTSQPTERVVTSGAFAEPQFLLDWQGLLAFIPWDPGKQGGHGAARYLNDKWTTLGPALGWPEYVLHLIPLLDGTVLQLVLNRPSDDDPDAGPDKPKPALAAADPHAWPVKLGFFDLDHAQIEVDKIKKLAYKLGDDDEKVRDDAFKELTRYGPSIWPILKSMYDDAVPEAQSRMKQLLRNQAAPLLGGMSLSGDDIRLVCRNDDGSAVFYTEKGVESPGPEGEPAVTAPAWLAVRPGHSVELLPASLTVDLKPDKVRITPVVDEWIVDSDVRGPRRFIGNGFVNLLKKDEAEFTQLVGEDHRGRWLFRKPVSPGRATAVGNPVTAPTTDSTGSTGSASLPQAGAGQAPASEPSTTQPATTQAAAQTRPAQVADDTVETLIIDPTMPNLVPRLPVWNYTTADEVGWDRDDWPAVKQLNNVSRLTDNGWEVATADNPLLTRPEQAPAVPGPPATHPSEILPLFQTPQTPAPATLPGATTAPTPGAATAPVPTTLPGAATAPATEAVGTTEVVATTEGSASELRPSLTSAPTSEAASTEPSASPLWVDRDGTKYFNGIDELRVVSPSGTTTTWTLPDSAKGQEPVHLVRTADCRLYLFNQPGRVLRLKPTPGGAAPFTIEATFTHNIPNVDRPTRVWLDPGGRIIMAYDKNLAILFPAGYLPPRIRLLISDVDDEDSDTPKP
jgi:hypothetical protein